jgi:hypothetical protein
MMYATRASKKYSRMLQIWLTLLFALAFLAAAAGSPGVPSPPLHGFREDSRYVHLFTPPRLPPGTYRTWVSAEPLDTVLAAVRRDRSLGGAPGSFDPQPVQPREAFGQSGGYNRWKLALLYGGTRARVARGPRTENGQVTEAWTLISPYPDPELERLEQGTLLIVLHLR